MIKICPNCGKGFLAKTYTQVYCCPKCGVEYRAKGEHAKYPVITFNCACCGRLVTTDGEKDKRTRFCSHDCEKQFYRHPPESKKSQIRNLVSLKRYLSWEKWTNEFINTGC